MADRISELPNEILVLTLSFLPTEDAIAIVLLSKRWRRPLWLSVPTLDFNQERYERRREKQQCCFADFVRTTIHACSHQPIKGFRLLTKECYYCELWLNKAIQRGVENLEVECYPSFDLPSNMFNCTTLVSHKLTWASFKNKNGLSSVNLPSLKTLHLANVVFSKPKYFMEFLYGCPILEILGVDSVNFDGFSCQGKFKSLPKLVKAKVSDLGEFEEVFHIPLKVFSNVKFLSLDQYYFNEDIPMFPNLLHLKLDWGNCFELKWNSVLDILNYSPNLQIFSLDLPYSFCQDWPNPQFAPQCFSSQLTECIIKMYLSRANQMAFAKYVMQNSTSLRTMTIICSSYLFRNDLHHKKELAHTKELASCPRTCELLFK